MVKVLGSFIHRLGFALVIIVIHHSQGAFMLEVF